MKKTVFILAIILIASIAYAQDYYWYRGEKMNLKHGNMCYVVYPINSHSPKNILFAKKGIIRATNGEKSMYNWGVIPTKEASQNQDFVYKTNSYIVNDTQNIYVTQRFYVKLKNHEDYSLLTKFAHDYDVDIEKSGVLQLWYILKCRNYSEHNALELANIFYESGLFAAAEPEFINGIVLNCANDKEFANQWNLKNTGQYGAEYVGLDINYCPAHDITSGSNSVIIALIDKGVRLDHADLNIYPVSYDIDNDSFPSHIYDSHGTACAGIIGALANDSGIVGIAPDCPIMSISFSDDTTPDDFARGFCFARDNGASVISNSWGLFYSSEYLNDAIDSAIRYGRNGLGCIVVFGAGNAGYGQISYPANSNPDIIVVGAISTDGKRKTSSSGDGETWWGSNYGNLLDIMAPGVLIPTTGVDSMSMFPFGGTSAACPQVAAVAGLILSVNPYLTQKKVADIIESTAQKIGSGYTHNPNRPNGTWNNEMGYGLVDAYAAVTEAQNRLPKIQGPDYICYGDTVCYQLIDMPAGATCTWSINSLDRTGTYRIVQGQGTTNLCVTHTDPYSSIPVEPIRVAPVGDADLNAIFPPVITISNTIKAVITMEDNSTYTVTKKFHDPKGQVPTIESSSTAPWKSGQTRYFTITNNTSAPGEDLLWEIMDVLLGDGMENNDTTYSYDMGGSIAYTPYVPNNYLRLITITATNTFEACGEQSSSITIGVSPAQSPFLLSAAVESNQLNIAILQEDEVQKLSSAQLNESSVYTLELSHSIYGSMRTQQISGANQQINTVGLPKGVYVLILKENNTIIAQTKVKIQ